jgi:hypothetical protein
MYETPPPKKENKLCQRVIELSKPYIFKMNDLVLNPEQQKSSLGNSLSMTLTNPSPPTPLQHRGYLRDQSIPAFGLAPLPLPGLLHFVPLTHSLPLAPRSSQHDYLSVCLLVHMVSPISFVSSPILFNT